MIRTERMNRDWSQKDLAERTGISCSRISSIEKGKSVISVDFLIRLSEAFEMPVQYLVTGTMSAGENGGAVLREISDCSDQELLIIADSISAIKRSLRKYRSA